MSLAMENESKNQKRAKEMTSKTAIKSIMYLSIARLQENACLIVFLVEKKLGKMSKKIFSNSSELKKYSASISLLATLEMSPKS
jgi:hypothetical protein